MTMLCKIEYLFSIWHSYKSTLHGIGLFIMMLSRLDIIHLYIMRMLDVEYVVCLGSVL